MLKITFFFLPPRAVLLLDFIRKHFQPSSYIGAALGRAIHRAGTFPRGWPPSCSTGARASPGRCPRARCALVFLPITSSHAAYNPIKVGGFVIATPNRSLWEQLRDEKQRKPTSLAPSEMPGHDLELKWDEKFPQAFCIWALIPAAIPTSKNPSEAA